MGEESSKGGLTENGTKSKLGKLMHLVKEKSKRSIHRARIKIFYYQIGTLKLWNRCFRLKDKKANKNDFACFPAYLLLSRIYRHYVISSVMEKYWAYRQWWKNYSEEHEGKSPDSCKVYKSLDLIWIISIWFMLQNMRQKWTKAPTSSQLKLW